SVITAIPPRPTLFPYTTLFRSLSDAALLIRNRDDGRHLFLPPLAYKKSRRSDPATGFLYMGAASRKPPRTRLTLRLLPVHWQAKDRKSTRLNSSHQIISYAVFC